MKFLATLLVLPAAAFAVSTTLSWDSVYDNKSGSMDTVACSDGSNGLENRGFKTFGSLPTFPNIGGIPDITEWNSASCGTCWNVTYVNGQGKSKSITVTGIDVGSKGFNVAQAAMNTLTNNQAVSFGRVNVNAVKIAASNCGL
ncbi:hypothetical protein NP233_g6905 [Leucocoprinus birnbaumii]|uniref:Cerato-platanin n=1 Tax=Leucocoprinus birnbaumii TaxID=56174 RepID=A0AAD5YV44_9AGAR|nr:hypothetical protein NP233_g6905 [Leucocoprinus birnbaumii]